MFENNQHGAAEKGPHARSAFEVRHQTTCRQLGGQAGQAELTGALSRLLAVVENYPDLKASQNFLALQAQLEGTENRIAVARRDYIEAVRVYNTSLRTFPTVLWASLWFTDNEPFQTFTIDAEDMDAPKVDFDKNG